MSTMSLDASPTLEQLQDFFPQLTLGTIWDVVSQVGADQALEMLLQLGSEEPDTTPTVDISPSQLMPALLPCESTPLPSQAARLLLDASHSGSGRGSLAVPNSQTAATKHPRPLERHAPVDQVQPHKLQPTVPASSEPKNASRGWWPQWQQGQPLAPSPPTSAAVAVSHDSQHEEAATKASDLLAILQEHTSEDPPSINSAVETPAAVVKQMAGASSHVRSGSANSTSGKAKSSPKIRPYMPQTAATDSPGSASSVSAALDPEPLSLNSVAGGGGSPKDAADFDWLSWTAGSEGGGVAGQVEHGEDKGVTDLNTRLTAELLVDHGVNAGGTHVSPDMSGFVVMPNAGAPFAQCNGVAPNHAPAAAETAAERPPSAGLASTHGRPPRQSVAASAAETLSTVASAAPRPGSAAASMYSLGGSSRGGSRPGRHGSVSGAVSDAGSVSADLAQLDDSHVSGSDSEMGLALLVEMFPEHEVGFLEDLLGNCGGAVEAAMQRLMELQDDEAAHLVARQLTELQQSSTIDQEVLEHEVKVQILRLEFPMLAPEIVENALQAQAGGLQAAAALLHFQHKQELAARELEEKEAADREVAERVQRLQEQEAVRNPPKPGNFKPASPNDLAAIAALEAGADFPVQAAAPAASPAPTVRPHYQSQPPPPLPRRQPLPASQSLREQRRIADDNLYQEMRAPAQMLYDQAKQRLEEAAAALRKGNRHEGIRLKKMHAELYKQAQEADREASDALTKAKNMGLNGIIVIDLHGQHVYEALARVENTIPVLKHCVPGMKIITGKGLHSEGEARLTPAMRSLLEDSSFRFEEKPGHFLLHFR